MPNDVQNSQANSGTPAAGVAVTTPEAGAPAAQVLLGGQNEKAVGDQVGADKAAADAAIKQPEAAKEPAKVGGDKGADEGGKAKVVPEKYEFKIPDGLQQDPEIMSSLEALAKENGLTQEAAQKFADLGAKVAKQNADAAQKFMDETRAKWVDSVRADKEIGGDKLAANLAVAKKAIDAANVPELASILNQSGLGDHPAVIKAFYRLGLRLSEDTMVAANGGKSGDVSAEKRLFPNLK